MQRSTLIILIAVAIGTLGEIAAENKPSIASEFLSVLAKNVATVLSPTLVGELNDGRPNRTVTNATIVVPIVARLSSESTKSAETTTESTRSSSLEADTVRSAQTQSEVRPGNGNGGFPFNLDDNYRYNYPTIGAQAGGSSRPDYPSLGPFGNYYNGDYYRGVYGGEQTGPDGNSPRAEQVAGVSPVETIGDGQAVRTPDNLEPTGGPGFDRFRNFERFPYRNQFADGVANFPGGSFLTGQRQAGRFGQSAIGDPYNTGLQGTANFHPNFRNSIGPANNFGRNYYQQLGDPYQQRFRSNNFDFLSSQRFQNSYDNYPRSLQRGPSFSGFYPGPYEAGLRNVGRDVAASGDPRKTIEETSPSELRPKSEFLKTNKSTNFTRDADAAPEILSVQGRVRFGRLLLPSLDDYDDLRFRPDDFREYLFAPNDKNNTIAIGSNNSTVNDI